MIIKGKKIRLKIFDITVVFVFIFVIISLFLILFRKQSEINVVITVNEESLAYQTGGVPNWFVQFLHVGMKEKDVFGRPIAEIKGIRAYCSSGQKSVVHIMVTLKTVYSISTHQHTYKGKNVLIGSTIEIPLENLLIKGLIINVDGLIKTNSKRIFAQARILNYDPTFPQSEGVSSYIADSINEGDVMKDSLGKPVIKIVKKTVDDAKMTVITANGDVLLQKNPLRRDVYLDLEIWADKIGDRYYLFGDTNFPIIISTIQGLPFYNNNRLIWLTITKINDIQ